MRAWRWAIAAATLLAATPARGFDNEASFGPLRITHGHGELIASAVVGTPFEADREALFQAQWTLDFPGTDPHGAVPTLDLLDLWRALVASYEPAEQRKHFLRWWSGLPAWRSVTHPLAQDWSEAVGYWSDELRLAYGATTRREQLSHLGHALHTLQDSYSPAHVERREDDSIALMRYYPTREPRGHRIWGEEGDLVRDAQGQMRPPALRAIAASRAMLLEFAAVPPHQPDRLEAFLGDFTARHFPLRPGLPSALRHVIVRNI